MTRFEKISAYKDVDLAMPTRATKLSAGYDLAAAEDIVIPPISFLTGKVQDAKMADKDWDYYGFMNPLTLDDMAKLTKELKAKATLVPTGMKCYLEPNQYLAIVARSSLPLKHLLIVANAPGTIDSDYADCLDNEGHIFVQLLNLGPFAIKIHRGDVIAQGIIQSYCVTDDDDAEGERKGGFGSTDGN